MGDLVPKVKIVWMSGVVVGSNETREDGSKKVVPSNRLDTVLFQMLETMVSQSFSLERDLRDPTSEGKFVRKVILHHPHHHDSAHRFIHWGRRREIGHYPVPEITIGDMFVHQFRHTMYHRSHVHDIAISP